MNEFKTNHANIIKNILDDTFDEKTAQDSIVDNLSEKVREAKWIIENNPKYQEITQDGDDPDETDESEESED